MKLYLFAFIILATSCRTTTSPGIFSKKTPHEQYGKKINDAGLQSTELGKAWFNAASISLSQPTNIKKPYKETGFFAADKPGATGFRFLATRGEKLQITIARKPGGFKLYLDLWQQDTTNIKNPANLKLLASSDTTGIAIEHEVDKSGYYLLRIQPELLQDCEYTVDISAVASLAYPIKAPGKNHTKSFWGVDRDAGARRHEGIDMFAVRHTPVVAAANGRVTRVNTNNLGGKVVWMRPSDKDYNLYYAHLDSQLVQDGQSVKIGDTLGLMGNTGNARTTPPHLHFGIYTMGGAIDPFPFVNPDYPSAAPITANVNNLAKPSRAEGKKIALHVAPESRSASTQIPSNTFLKPLAAVAGWYRVVLPGGEIGYIDAKSTGALTSIKMITTSAGTALLSQPDSLAPMKTNLGAGTKIQQLALYKNYLYVRVPGELEGWITL